MSRPQWSRPRILNNLLVQREFSTTVRNHESRPQWSRSHILNNLLFQQEFSNTIDAYTLLLDVTKYMLVVPMVALLQQETKSPTINKKQEYKSKTSFQPEDQIFWCIFRHVYPGEESTLLRYKNREIEEKLKIVESMKKTPACLKMMKITKQATQEIMGDIMTNTKCTLFTLHALAVFYQIQIIVIDHGRKMYIEYCDPSLLSSDDEITTCIIERKFLNGKEYFVSGNEETNYRTLYLKQHTYEKTLRAISTYKVSDLEEIASITHFDKSVQPKWTKPSLYEALLIWLARIPKSQQN